MKHLFKWNTWVWVVHKNKSSCQAESNGKQWCARGTSVQIDTGWCTGTQDENRFLSSGGHMGHVVTRLLAAHVAFLLHGVSWTVALLQAVLHAHWLRTDLHREPGAQMSGNEDFRRYQDGQGRPRGEVQEYTACIGSIKCISRMYIQYVVSIMQSTTGVQYIPSNNK